MDRAKEAVGEFLNHNNKHSVDIEQTTAPAVVHERVQEARHENVTTAIDREVHQHHHQIHVQPIADKVVEPEQHHVNVIPVEHRQHHHGKDREIEAALTEQQRQFRDEQEVLAAQHSKSHNTIVGEHVHHHIHDTIQPVIERERIQQHVVHTTIPIHERIDKEPVIHSGNVLPTKTLAEFEAAGHSLAGGITRPEHIDYEGEPLKIKDDSRVGFGHSHRHEGVGSVGRPGELGTAAGVVGAAGILEGHHHHNKHTAGPHNSNIGNEIDPRVDSDLDGKSGLGRTTGVGAVGSGLTGHHTTAGPHDKNLLNKADPRVDSDLDGKSGLGRTTGTGVTGTHGLTSGTSSEFGVGNTGSTGLGSGRTGVSEVAGTNTYDETTTKPSTTDKLLSKIGMK